MSDYVKQRQLAKELLKDEPGGDWHPLCEVHVGGPSWRWPQAEVLDKPFPTMLDSQKPNLNHQDLLPR